jgi:hypothetical protein
MQVLQQLWVLKLQTAFYILALPDTSTSSGKIAYIVMGHLSLAHANDFFDQCLDRIRQLLLPLYSVSAVDKALEVFLVHLEPCVVELFNTR